VVRDKVWVYILGCVRILTPPGDPPCVVNLLDPAVLYVIGSQIRLFHIVERVYEYARAESHECGRRPYHVTSLR
jgi:hypothetical protein